MGTKQMDSNVAPTEKIQKPRKPRSKKVYDAMDLAAKIKLIEAVPTVKLRIRVPDVSMLTGWSPKKLEADRPRGVGLPFTVDQGSIFYDLRTVLDHCAKSQG